MTELWAWKQAAGGAAFLLTFLFFVPYIRGIRRRETVPHVFSWIVWAFGTLVVFFAQLAGGAGLGAWPIGLSACLTAYVAWLAFQVRGRVEITRHDWVLFVLALLAALEHYSWTTALFPAAVGGACLLVALFVLSRRALLSQAT